MTRRKRSPHPGIVLRPGRPEKREPPHIRWTDPDTGKQRTERVPDELVEDRKELKRWLVTRSVELQAARATAKPGAERLPLSVLVEKFKRHQHRTADTTQGSYRTTFKRLTKFAGDVPVTGQLLIRFREKVDVPGAAAATVNKHLAHVRSFANFLREYGHVRLTLDEISAATKKVSLKGQQRKMHYTIEELHQLLSVLNETEPAYRAFVIVLLLTGMRLGEGVRLRAHNVERTMNRLVLGTDTKTRKGRFIPLNVSPAVWQFLPEGWDGFGLTIDQAIHWRKRAHPRQTFQRLRVTCGTYLTCAPGIYGGASATMSARRLGHSVKVAEDHYVNQVLVDPSAKTLEEAMGIKDLL